MALLLLRHGALVHSWLLAFFPSFSLRQRGAGLVWPMS